MNGTVYLVGAGPRAISRGVGAVADV